MKPSHISFLAFATLALGIPQIQAALLAYEGFNYGAGSVVGATGGAGFSGPWVQGGFNVTQSADYSISSPSLSFSPLTTSGNHASATSAADISGVTRSLVNPLGAVDTTRYFSFLIRPEGVLGQGAFNGFYGLVLESPTEPEVFIGQPGAGDTAHYVLEERGGAGQFPSSVAPVVGQTALFVLKAEFLAGNDRFTLFVNPTPGGPEPAGGVVKQDNNMDVLSGLTLYSTGAYSIDELRVGETFADVTPVPEPTSVALGAVGVALASLGRRRRSECPH